MYLIDFASNFAENIGNYAQNIIAIYLKYLPLLYQTMVIIDVRAYPFFNCF